MSRRKNEPVDVFKYIDMPPDGDPKPCWPWTGGTGGREDDKRGYFTIAGVKWLAYRLVYVLIHGELPDGQVVRHKCDNGMCCNPYHLVSGTQSDNENDKYERDRWGFPRKVLDSIIEWSNKGLQQQAVAAMVSSEYGLIVTQQRVSDIVNGVRRARQTQLVKEKTK